MVVVESGCNVSLGSSLRRGIRINDDDIFIPIICFPICLRLPTFGSVGLNQIGWQIRIVRKRHSRWDLSGNRYPSTHTEKDVSFHFRPWWTISSTCLFRSRVYFNANSLEKESFTILQRHHTSMLLEAYDGYTSFNNSFLVRVSFE